MSHHCDSLQSVDRTSFHEPEVSCLILSRTIRGTGFLRMGCRQRSQYVTNDSVMRNLLQQSLQGLADGRLKMVGSGFTKIPKCLCKTAGQEAGIQGQHATERERKYEREWGGGKKTATQRPSRMPTNLP